MPHYQANAKQQPIHSITLQNTNITLSGTDHIATFNTLASLLTEEQAAHQRTKTQLAEALQAHEKTNRNLAITENNVSIINSRMQNVEAELNNIICPFHSWNCKSRVSCAQTSRRKLEEYEERIGELEEDVATVDQRCSQGYYHRTFTSTSEATEQELHGAMRGGE